MLQSREFGGKLPAPPSIWYPKSFNVFFQLTVFVTRVLPELNIAQNNIQTIW